MTDILERLREQSDEKHSESWLRLDGGLDLSIGAMLADEAADTIEDLRAENERLRILVKDSVNLLDFLFEPGSYIPAVRLFCEKVKEELK